MIIALTGTPGTGKSTVAPLLAEELGYDLLDLNEFIADNGLQDSLDVERESMMVDTEALDSALRAEINDDVVIDGHLAHWFSGADVVVVLRADPTELETRLAERDWSDEKVEENAMAERIDVILQEAVAQHPDTAFEIDTTGRDPAKVCEEITYLLAHPDDREMYTAGSTAWDMDGL